MLNILVLCTGNSCRSIIGEALINHLGADRLHAWSAGSQPTGQVNPGALAILREHGVASEGYSSKSWDSLGDVTFDMVITVCDNAAGEACPLFSGKALKAHWGIPDPAHVTGSEADIHAAFAKAYTQLEARIQQLLNLPLDDMDDDSLRAALNQIGANTP
ncbi:ArsC family transcriptional regulator [Pseudomonas taeanensis MS-3]|jgi:arsenate reductase (thioredoxin)|uniref:ArsC family transcriptional regulator n=1 Tax=Pseudomonas taeanensis MS-3 TaxID=1395571 RepID=A0A0A1YKM1_9PSED|nr:arsenate reductase ArsC [Pseudomonas taeanensis]KFX69224.1 ArsC family transcriptional regulator [Pseudomonas taeanensis MS-3]